MAWLYSVASSLGTVTELASRGRWANHNQHIIEEGTTDFYKTAVMLNEYGKNDVNTTTFILKPVEDFEQMQVTVPSYYKWLVPGPHPGERNRTFHVWLENGEKRKFLIYAKMDNSFRVYKHRLEECYAYISKHPVL